MKEIENSKSSFYDSEQTNQQVNNKKYFEFFEHAPVALYIEDFSKLKAFVEEKAKENNLDLNTYLINNAQIVKQLHYLVIIKEVNETAVKLYKAKNKSELLDNIEKVFTPASSEGFYKLVFDILSGKTETAVETINKTLEGDEIQILIKYKLQDDNDQALKNVIVSIEDITQRVKINNALTLSEKRYKESQELAKIASWFYDFNTKQLSWSDEVYKILDLPKDSVELNLALYLSSIYKDDLEIVNDFSFENLLKNPIQNLNYRIVTKNGEIKYLYEKRSVTVKNGKIERIVGICQDITERILSGQSLTVTKQLLSNTLSNIQDGFVILDENSNYLYINNVAADLLGKSIEDLLGKNIWKEFPENEGDEFYDNYQWAFQTRKPISFENYFAPWNRWFENRIIPSNNTMLIFFHETTEKKESEHQIKAAYNIINKSSSVAILCENKWDFPVIFASENTEKLFGYTSSELLSNQVKIFELIYPKDLEHVRAEFFTQLKSETEIESKPKAFRIVTKNNEIKWIEARTETIRNRNNIITHIQGILEDITERKKAEDLIFKSNQRLQDQFNNTPLASIIWDLDFRVTDWNNSAQRIFGFTPEEAIGKKGSELIVKPDQTDDLKTVWENLLNQTGGFRNKNENITKNGNVIICDWYNVTLKDLDGNVIGVASLADDITDKNTSKILLEKSEKKYRDIFEKSFDAVLILKDNLIVDCNESTLKMFGHTNKESLLKIHPSIISPKTQPDGSDSALKAEKMIQIAVDEGSNRFRWYHQTKNETIFPAEVTLTKIEEEDHITTIHAVVKDISARVKKEQIETILYNISKAALSIEDFNEFGYFVKDELHKIIDTNNFFIALYNEEKDNYYTPVLVDEMESGDEFPAEGTLTNYVVKNKKSLLFNKEIHDQLIQKGEVKLVGVDSKIWVGVPLISKNKVFGAIVVQSYTNENAYTEEDVQLLEFVADQISSAILRKNTDFELKKALSKAQESDRLKSAFLANMSHEIRTPMNGIIGFSELFLDKDLSYNERKEYAKIVIDSSKQLLSIVNDILDISKIEAGVVQLNYETVDLNALLNNLNAFYMPIASEKKLELICNKGLKNQECSIKIDKTKLNQILTNLLSNAFKFTDNGSIQFGYELVDTMLRFYVKDTGVGIDEKLHHKIFDRFVQADVDFEKQNKGTGLGLAISKKFIELFGGDIWLTSNSNGTTVSFTIPYVKVAPQVITSVVEKTKHTKVENKTITILVAEDEIYNLMYINELFSKTSYKIVEANNGKEAVDIALNNNDIDLILMDIKMPIMNGKDAMKEIKKVKPHLPIIALSAFAMESDKESALSHGFDSYLSKPIDKNVLFEKIEKFSK
ncbi:PAS domain S-box protein [Lutibacter sp. HS1-25]|uniref:PAS domain S-box protein n=1 Tax=Lutibacter sp. HS1-25 TaxID=2485000 RepID=UPI001013AF10|nr:PAS domain S-box protein [Lutibacter sp. HS1-25]RXP64496.1 PAS domain S-box protein [Lutibacter sp. HS1-25]